MDPHTTPELQCQSRTSVHTPNATLPPVISGTDKRALHRAEAHTNICLICQLPRWSHGHPPGEAVCCCDGQEGAKLPTRRFTTTGREQHSFGHIAPPIQVGQRRHSLMMARLNEGKMNINLIRLNAGIQVRELYTHKNAQVVTNLQQTCSNAVPTTCHQDLFALLVPSLLTTCYKVVELNRLATSCSNNLLSSCNSTTCQQVVRDNLVAT
jgi:hypothetical protein